MMRWSPGSPGPAAERAWSPDAQQRLETVGRILDESRDLLDVALDRNTTVEHGLRRADQQTRDLQWDAAKILLDNDPARPAMRTVQEVGDQLVTARARPRTCGTPCARPGGTSSTPPRSSRSSPVRPRSTPPRPPCWPPGSNG